MRLVLASSSPRRRELLAAAGVKFTVVSAEIDETRHDGEPAVAFARRLAREKAEAVLAKLPGGNLRVLGADTIVICEHRVFGKPRDREDAGNMLRLLSGRSHDVITAVCLVERNAGDIARNLQHATTTVRFRSLARDEIDSYVESGEPMDKAGAYAIQGGAAGFVEHYEGDYDNVVGLPVALVLSML